MNYSEAAEHSSVLFRSDDIAIENKNPSRIFPSDFDKLSETLEDIIEGHVASQGQSGQVRESQAGG